MSAALRAVGFGFGGMAVVAFVALMAWGLSNKTPVTGLSGLTRVQQPAPPFTLPLFGGGELDLATAKGRPVVINFWASWCAPCRTEARDLERAWQGFLADGVLFVGVAIQDADEDARAHLKEFGVTYPNGPDADGKITVDYGVIGIPTTFFIGKQGIVERRWVGELDRPRLNSWVGDLVAGVPPTGEVDGGDPDSFYGLDGRR